MSLNDIHQMGVAELAAAIADKQTSAVEAAQALLARAKQHQNLGAAVGSLLERGAVVGQACAWEGGTHTLVLAGVDGAGGLAQRALAGGAPGVVGGDVEVALARQGLGQVLAEHAGAHPGAVALAEQVALAVLAGGSPTAHREAETAKAHRG